MISEEIFAQEEKRMGKQVHFHDGVWWVKAAPFYYKPVHEFNPFPPKSAKPHPLKALFGYSHQMPESSQADRYVRWNVIHGDDLNLFSLDRLKSKRRNMVRGGMRDCQVKTVCQIESLLEEMRKINISQAKRFEGAGEKGTFLPAQYYECHAVDWQKNILKTFSHKGHKFVGAFVGERLAAYVDLIQIEDTWLFGAVKSSEEYLKHRPVDALYFSILSMAAQNAVCKRVLNGGGNDERVSLARFKADFLLKPVSFPYYTRAIIPLDKIERLKYKFDALKHAQQK
jgi:hypothetical protein